VRLQWLVMARPREEGLLAFQGEVVQLYDRLKVGVEVFCKRHDVEISFWCKPSTISQPKFMINAVGLDADERCSEKNPMPLTNRLKHKVRKATG